MRRASLNLARLADPTWRSVAFALEPGVQVPGPKQKRRQVSKAAFFGLHIQFQRNAWNFELTID
jgi:hypothetical protein